MTDTKEDYRNSQYCPNLVDVKEKKDSLDALIRKESPRTKIIYNKISSREEKYNKMFAEIYNCKCGYCGCQWGLLPLESFEVDHFINEASFLKTAEGKSEAGKIDNLIWSCVSCNRGKQGLTIEAPYTELLNPDFANIASVFERDEQYYIKISEKYKDDKFINKFYEQLHLGYEARRLDYLLLEMAGLCQRETDEKKKNKLYRMMFQLSSKRNKTSVYENKNN